MVRRRDVLLAVLAAARPCAAWVVFDGKRLEQVVPSGQLAKNSSDVLTTGETIRLSLSDGFPGMFRWSAKPALRYAVSPDFCDAMKGTMIEEDGWLLDMFPESLHPPIKWTTCDRLRQIVRQAFDSWQENNPSLHFVDVTDRCTAEQAWLPIDELLCADSQPCLTLYDTEGRAGPGSTAVDDNNNPEICSSKTCFECERADILIGAFIQGGRQLAEARPPRSRRRGPHVPRPGQAAQAAPTSCAVRGSGRPWAMHGAGRACWRVGMTEPPGAVCSRQHTLGASAARRRPPQC